MAIENSDILMRVMDANNNAIAADAVTDPRFDDRADSLALGFTAGKVFELKDFRFSLGKAGMSIDLEEGETLSVEQQAAILKANEERLQAEKAGVQSIEVEPVTFTRYMDSASPRLLNALVAKQTLQSISIIKRRATGTNQAGRVYFRVDFSKVLLIGIDWDDEDHRVKEQCKFICRRVEMKYRLQNPDGTFGAVVPGSWMIAN